VVRSGIIRNFFGIGVLNHQQTFSQGNTYMIIDNNQYPALNYYTGSETWTTLWIEPPGGSVITIPVKLDNTGIYFTMKSNMPNVAAGATFRFTVALVLIDPNS